MNFSYEFQYFENIIIDINENKYVYIWQNFDIKTIFIVLIIYISNCQK